MVKQGKIKNNHHAEVACVHCYRYEEDLELVQALGFDEYRFSLSWSRLYPDGTGKINPEGVDFYHRLIDKCLALNLKPWIILYFRVVVRYSFLRPVLWAAEVKPWGRRSAMGWEVSPEGLYRILKQFGACDEIKEIIISEKGAAFPDIVQNGEVYDPERIGFFNDCLQNALRAKREGVNLTGYFVWSVLDNLEWPKGTTPALAWCT